MEERSGPGGGLSRGEIKSRTHSPYFCFAAAVELTVVSAAAAALVAAAADAEAVVKATVGSLSTTADRS